MDFSIPPEAKSGNLTEFNNCNTEEDGRTVECATIAVSENRPDPNSRLISLPIKIVRSFSKPPDEAVFHLAGGPAASNLSSWPHDNILQTHDFVSVGYRGVEGSVRLLA